jgi:molybdopterin molybdotransferase
MNEPGDVTKLISVREAIDIIDRTEVHPRVVRVPLGEADGMRLAADVAADRDYPPFAKSLMDGYAVKSADVVGRGAPGKAAELKIVGEVAAGATLPEQAVQHGEAMSIMTGAPLPRGADGVVPVEDTERTGESTVRILRAGQPVRYVAARGSDVARGVNVLKRGTTIGPQQAAVLATVGAWEVECFDRPSVALLGTGNELAGPGEDAGASKIRNSNTPMVAALLRRLGCKVSDLGICRDEPDAIRAKLEEGLKHDALFVSGGMSMGEYDFVPRLLVELGVELRITKLRIKPGKPFVFGVKGNSFAFGLPGNPVSAFVCTMRLASRLLDRLAGGEIIERWQTGRLAVGMLPNGPREFYQPVIRSVTPARNSSQSVIGGVRPLAWKGSADLFTLAAANGLLVRGENEPALPMGTVVRVLEI